MSRLTGRHEPTPEFRARLEREIVRSLRRGSPEPAAVSASSRWQRYRTAALVVIALGVGALGGAVSAQVQESRQRDQLLAAAQADVQLATMRAEMARTQVEAIRRRHALGTTDRESLAAAEAELHRMEAALGRSRLNLEEVRASAAPPRDDLAAPLVRGRDFVRERMLLDLAAAQQQLTAVERVMAEAERRNRVGLASGLVLLEARTEVMRARADIELVARRLELRQEFLRQDLAPGDVTRRAQRLELLHAVQVAEEVHRLAQARLAHVRERHSLGQGGQVELLSAELAVAVKQLELQLIRRQLDLLDGLRSR